MAIEIIEPGNNQNPILRGRCHVCNALIQCLKSDMKHEDKFAAESYIDCPTDGCYGQIVISKMLEVKDTSK